MIRLRNVQNIHNLNSNIALCSTKAQLAVPPALVNKSTSTSKAKDEWQPFYKLPFIGPIASLNRIKTYHFIITGLVVPVTTALSLHGTTPPEIATTFASIG
jgi:hypothetical protein